VLVGYAQIKPIFGRKERNLQRALKLLGASSDLGADLMVLPELFNTGYAFKNMKEVEKMSETVPDGLTSQALMSFAEESGLHVCAGISERHRRSFYNSAILVGPSGPKGLYRKTHLFAEEKRWFEPGNTGFRVFSVKDTKVGIIICFDWFFPESVRTLALRGAEVVCHPANLVLPYCQTAMLGAAIQNKVFIITANRIGTERGLRFTGRSQIIGPDMRVLASSGLGEDIKAVGIVPEDARDKHVTELNDVFEDRRPGLYSPICSND